MTPGVALLLQQAVLVAHARQWEKDKLIGKLQDVIAVLNGQDPSAHSDRQAAAAAAQATGQPITPEEQTLIDQAEGWLKAIGKPQATEADKMKQEISNTLGQLGDLGGMDKTKIVFTDGEGFKTEFDLPPPNAAS